MINENQLSPINIPDQKINNQSAERADIFRFLDQKLYDNKLIVDKEGIQEFDLTALRHLKISGSFLNTSVGPDKKKEFISRQDLLDYFTNHFGVAKNDQNTILADSEESDFKNIKPFFSLPEDIEKAKEGKFEDGLLKPWEFMASPDFNSKIELLSGEKTSLVELFYLKKLKELQFQRDENDNLSYFNKDTNKFERFYSGQCDKIFGRDISFKENGVLYGLTVAPELFIKKYLPLVDSLNIFKPNDFKRIAGTRSADILFTNDKKFNSRNPYYGTSIDKDFVRYYVGREKIVGTDKKISDNMFVRELSKDLVGIIESEHGRKKLLYTFEKLNKAEFSERGFPDMDNSNRMVSGKEMRDRIKDYKVSDYLPRYATETPEEYANRVADLNDVEFVTEKFRSIMSKAEVSLLNLTWAEQLAIANYSLEGNKEERLVNFAAKYGIEGLRAFLAVESDQAAGRRILEIGEKLPEQASMIFSKISSLNNLANYEANNLANTFLKDGANQEVTLKIHGDLLSKSNNILSKFDDLLKSNSKNKEKNIALIVKELEAKQVENSILVSILKSAKESGQNIPLEMIKDLNLEKRTIDSKTGVGLSEPEKEQLIKIASENYQAIFLQKGKNYNPEAYKRVIDNYKKELENLDGQSIYILKYKNEIVCSSRFKKLSEYAVYGASFNVSKEIQGLSLGANFHEKVLEDVSENYDIHISTRKDNPANKSYERSGFVITNEYKEEDGVEYYKMIKPSKASLPLEKAA